MSKKNLVMILGVLVLVVSLLFTSIGATAQAPTAVIKYPILALAGPGGTVSPAGIVLVPSGGAKGFTIKPAKGYHIVDVLVDGVSQGQILKYAFINVTAKHRIHALFASSLMINAGAGAGGTISPSGMVPVVYGQPQAFTFTPNPGYYVSNVIVDGIALGKLPGFTFKGVKAAHSIIALFNNVYPVLATGSEGGAVSPSGVVMLNAGAYQNFTLTPNNDDYHIVNIRLDEEWIGKDNPNLVWNGSTATYNLTDVSSSHDILVVFAAQQYPIFSKANKGGAISPLGTHLYLAGDDQTYTITPDEGYYVSEVLVDGESKGSIASYEFENISAAHMIVAVFKKGTAPTAMDEE